MLIFLHAMNFFDIIIVNGGWGSWKCEKCSVTCGNGTLICTRECNNPIPAYGGEDCEGSSRKVLSCYKGCCGGKKLHVVLHKISAKG